MVFKVVRVTYRTSRWVYTTENIAHETGTAQSGSQYRKGSLLSSCWDWGWQRCLIRWWLLVAMYATVCAIKSFIQIGSTQLQCAPKHWNSACVARPLAYLVHSYGVARLAAFLKSGLAWENVVCHVRHSWARLWPFSGVGRKNVVWRFSKMCLLWV